MSETTNEGEAQVRAFWPSDYRKLASVIKGVRAEQGDVAATDLLNAVVPVLAADSPDFDGEAFTKSTVQVPAHYGQLARILKGTRHVRCQPYTAAAPAKLAKADMLEAALAEALSADPAFDAAVFATSSKAPEAAQAYGQTNDEDDDPDDD